MNIQSSGYGFTIAGRHNPEISRQSSVKEVSGERVQQKQLPQEIKRLLMADSQ